MSSTCKSNCRSSLVVRLECAAHPWDGRSTTAELEAAGAQRLLAYLASAKTDRLLAGLPGRARRYVRQAVRAYAAVRGKGPSVLPAGVAPAEEGWAEQ